MRAGISFSGFTADSTTMNAASPSASMPPRSYAAWLPRHIDAEGAIPFLDLGLMAFNAWHATGSNIDALLDAYIHARRYTSFRLTNTNQIVGFFP